MPTRSCVSSRSMRTVSDESRPTTLFALFAPLAPFAPLLSLPAAPTEVLVLPEEGSEEEEEEFFLSTTNHAQWLARIIELPKLPVIKYHQKS